MAGEFVLPEFMQNSSVDELHEEMLTVIPANIDKAEGAPAWDFTRPTALIVSEGVGFQIAEAIKQIFPMYSYGDALDNHAMTRGLSRKKATFATVRMRFDGTPETKVPSGFKVSTVADLNESSIEFYTLKEVSLLQDGIAYVECSCTLAGSIGNVVAESIIMQSAPLKGISKVINESEASGGVEAESDESLRTRITDYDSTQGVAFVGSIADYKRWAMEVDGVGNAVVIPANDDTGLVTIVIVDGNGDPATTAICTNVYNHIMRPDVPEARLAPINAYLSVVPPTTTAITVTAIIELKTGTLDDAVNEFLPKAKEYYKQAASDGEIKYTQMHKILADMTTANDFKEVTINGGTENIAISMMEMAASEKTDITFTSGIVGGDLL